MRPVREITGTKHTISIYWICSCCGDVEGVVNGDGRMVFYKTTAIRFLNGDKDSIPKRVCRRCEKETTVCT
jgi:hypothetical protein